MSKYFKQGSTVEYVEEYAEIQALKFENARHSVLGFMLGDYDENGSYVISPQIVKELIAMPKYIVEAVDNYEICKSLVKLDKQLTFLITYEGERVTLSLMESVNFEGNSKLNIGSWSNVSEYELDYVLVSGEVNRTAIYSKWNVSEYGGTVLDIMECEAELLEKYFGIVNRFKFLISQNIQLLEKEEELEQAEEEYFLNVLSILEDYPELKKLVVKEIKENLEDKKEIIKVDKPFFAKALNEVLNKAIESNLSSVKEEKQEEFKKLQHNAKVRLNIQRQEIIQCVTEKVSNLEKVQDKVENKKETAEIEKQVVVFETDTSYKKSTVVDLANNFVAKRKAAEARSEENAVAAILKSSETQQNNSPKTKKGREEERVQVAASVIAAVSTKVGYRLENNTGNSTKKKVEEARTEEREAKTSATSAETVAQTTSKASASTPVAGNGKGRQPVNNNRAGSTAKGPQKLVTKAGQNRNQGAGNGGENPVKEKKEDGTLAKTTPEATTKVRGAYAATFVPGGNARVKTETPVEEKPQTIKTEGSAEKVQGVSDNGIDEYEREAMGSKFTDKKEQTDKYEEGINLETGEIIDVDPATSPKTAEGFGVAGAGTGRSGGHNVSTVGEETQQKHQGEVETHKEGQGGNAPQQANNQNLNAQNEESSYEYGITQ